MHEFIYEVGLAVIGIPALLFLLYIGGAILTALNMGQEDAGRREY